jgi:hypothetical protein
LSIPIAGYVGHLIAGPVDAVWPALIGGSITGAGIGAAQWGLLRRRGVSVMWIPASATGLALGLAVGAAVVSYRTDLSSLVVMGAACGLAVGSAQGAVLGNARHMIPWAATTSALWALGWIPTTLGGIHVEDQFIVFGAYGAITVAFLQSLIVSTFVPAATVKP